MKIQKKKFDLGGGGGSVWGGGGGGEGGCELRKAAFVKIQKKIFFLGGGGVGLGSGGGQGGWEQRSEACVKTHIPPAVAIRGHFIWKEKWIKRLISNMWLIFLYTVQLLVSDVCTKFQNSRSSSSGEIFDKNFHIHYHGVRD